MDLRWLLFIAPALLIGLFAVTTVGWAVQQLHVYGTLAPI